MRVRVCTNAVVSTASGFWVPPELQERREGLPWYLPVLLLAIGGLLGGYLGAAVALVMWLTVGRAALDRRNAALVRVVGGVLGVAGGIAAYQAGLALLDLVLAG